MRRTPRILRRFEGKGTQGSYVWGDRFGIEEESEILGRCTLGWGSGQVCGCDWGGRSIYGGSTPDLC